LFYISAPNDNIII